MKRNWLNGVLACLIAVSALTSCGISKDAPNIIIVLTDDMDNSLTPYMENTNRLIAQEGATLTNYFVTASICCPSRASMLRGQYPHNTNVLENFPGFREFFKKGEEADTLAVWLQNAGYKTSLLGKYLNLYPIDAGRDHVPPGWTDWHAFLYKKGDADFYVDYAMNENGEYVEYGHSAEDYSTDVIKRKSLEFINANAADKSPFFMLVSVYAPHGPDEPAPRHAELFADLQYPQNPSFNEADTSDKPKIIESLAASASGESFDEGDADTLYVKRIRAMQAVDELVRDIVQTLENNGQLENTYIIFTSDNGFHMGEHALPSGKGMPYEEDIRVPFMIRGPGIQPNSQVTQIAANIDIAPTVADIAGVKPSKIVDGRSIMPLLNNESAPQWRKGLLVELGYIDAPKSSAVQNVSLNTLEYAELTPEYPDNIYDDYLSKVDGGAFRSVRAEDFIYIEYDNGETEYYDLVNDPYQLDNIAAKLDAETRARLHAWLEKLKTCAAESCRQIEEDAVK
ncbi:MAG: sulfatase [Anaerolineales bacterium]|nr:sulfatase [Anaerolineales bacterium]